MSKTILSTGCPFKIGDVVRLRSGGPTMTVSAIWASELVSCVWFDGNGAKQEHKFPHASIEKKP